MRGYTLLELIVVLILLTLATALVTPRLLSRGDEPASDLKQLIDNAKHASLRRGEMVRLKLERTGEWRLTAGGEILLSGRLRHGEAPVADLIFSPLGTCGPAIGMESAENLPALYPMTCEGPRP